MTYPNEFDVIARLKAKHKLARIGDDCAVIPGRDVDTLITADMLVEGIDFRREWAEPAFLGHKALAVSLSDIAAMGGVPKWALLSLAIPADLWNGDFVDEFYRGWHQLAGLHDVELVGGDISSSDGTLVIDCTVFGEVPTGRAVLRSGCRPGDVLFVTGYLGGAAGGLRLLEDGLRFDVGIPVPTRHLLQRQLRPLPQVRTGNTLQTMGLVSGMIDISDGLSSELHHLAISSQIGCAVEARQIPSDPALNILTLSDDDKLRLALNGGEDFELLLSVPPDAEATVRDLGLHRIGRVTDQTGCVEIMIDGNRETLPAKGFRHF